MEKSRHLKKGRKGELKLKFGIFFDGTQNSIANIDERKNYDLFMEGKKTEVAWWSRLAPLAKLFHKEESLFSISHRKNGSYHNEYTNVARLYKCFKKPKKKCDSKKVEDDTIFPIYVEGIGTKPRKIGKKIDFTKEPAKEKPQKTYVSLTQFIDENDGFVACSDDGVASALGVGLFGVKKKVESACEKIAEEVKNVLDKRKFKEETDVKLEFYVFGFSRGAAAARCFSSCLIKRMGKTKEEFTPQTVVVGVWKRTCMHADLERENTYKTSLMRDWLGDCFRKINKKSPFPINVSTPKVEFLGLYDTVSSYGAYFDDDVEELSLGIGKNVKEVFQICAGEEYRENFALTGIDSAGEKGSSIIIPGRTAMSGEAIHTPKGSV